MTCEAQLCAAGFGLGDRRPIASASHCRRKGHGHCTVRGRRIDFYQCLSELMMPAFPRAVRP
jgi:hypothetical protein